MKPTVKVSTLISEMEMQLDDWHVYLHTLTGEIVSISSEELRMAEEEESFEHLPDWQKESIEIAIDVVENFENYIELPTQFDINEYQIMEEFCYSLDNEIWQNRLLYKIRGKGAFRRFKDAIIDLGIEQNWYDYRDAAFREIAIDWCKENGLKWID